MIRHDQFIQDVWVIETMYRSLGSLRHDHIPKSEQWHAIMAEGPMDQIRETQAEMHEHLKLPDPIPPSSLAPDTDPAPRVASWADFNLALEHLCRLYRALGELHAEIHQFRPRLYASLAQQFLPQLYVVQSAMNAYLGWDATEATLDEMERQFAAADGQTPPAPTAPPAPQLSEEKS